MSQHEKPKKRRKARSPASEKDARARLEQNLSYLGLTHLLKVYQDHLAQAEKQALGYLEFFEGLIADEAAVRFDRRVQRRLSRARFPVIKTLEAYDWTHPEHIDRQSILARFDLEFVAKKRNVIFVGGTGLGKTHLSTSLGVAACKKGYNVLFRTALEIVNELTAAQSDKTFLRKLKALAKPDLLLIDELGYLPIDKHGADLLFQVVSQRYERGSIILTTNREPKQWGKVFNDPTVASAVLDRLAHHSSIFLIKGKSYRTQRKAN